MSASGSIDIPRATVKTIVCEDIGEAVSALTESSLGLEVDRRTVMTQISEIPMLEELIGRIISSMAEIAFTLWPEWYGRPLLRLHEEPNSIDDHVHFSAAVKEVVGSWQEVSSTWLRLAARMCRRGVAPLPAGFNRAVSARQIAIAIHPVDLLVVIVCTEASPPPERLLGLTRASEWLASETKARVAVVVSDELTHRRELDPILYGAIHLTDFVKAQAVPGKGEESKHIVWPIRGKPHPFSPGEQELAKRLQEDHELRGLFHFNQAVSTVRESLFLVDLVWPEGKIVVEVDGYRYHSNKLAFSSDRHRDYELMISGYMVLRLPHDEVTADSELALEKIRSVVKFRMGQSFNAKGDYT